MLLTTQEVLDRWEDYVGEVYTADKQMLTITNVNNQRTEKTTEEEILEIIGKLPRNKVTGVDNIPAEFLQCCGPESLKIIPNTIKRIYETGEYPEDFRTSTFIPVPKISNAIQCKQ